MGRRIALCAALVAGLGAALAAVPAGAVVGGTLIPTSQAPWQVAVLRSDALCGGVVVNARTVLTAAHCVVTDGGKPVPASAVAVIAGMDDLRASPAPPTRQSRAVSGVKIHPYYAPDTFEDDVALLTLAAPLDLGGTAVRALPLVPAGAPPSPGTAATVTGFGQSSVGFFRGGDDRLRAAAVTIAERDDRNCVLGPNSAVHVCAAPSPSGSCYGDSGGPLVAGSPAVLVGSVEGGITGDCSAGGNRFTNLAAPELRAFVLGEPVIPRAPRGGVGAGAPMLGGTWRVGSALECHPGTWSGDPAFTFIFSGGARPQSGGDSRYVLTPADLDRQIRCTVLAENAGGTGVVRTIFSNPIAAPPPEARPRVDVSSVRCRRRRCRLGIEVVEPLARPDAIAAVRGVARQRKGACRRRGCRVRRTTKRLHVRRVDSEGARFVATVRRLRAGAVTFRVRATSTATGLRSDAVVRKTKVRRRASGS